MKIRLRHNTMMRLIFGGVLIVGIPGLVFLVLWPLVGWFYALLPLLALWLVVIYGFFFGWRHIVVRTSTCRSPLLPQAFEGYRVLQLSDLHIGTFLRNRSFVDKVVAVINAEQPDLVVFTGDLVNVSAEEVIPFQHALRQIHARDGVFSIMGNHDYCEYGEDKSEHNVSRNQHVLRYMEEKMGWHMLMNEHVLIHREGSEPIALIGVENISRPPFPDYGDLKKAMDGLPDGMFKILLSHDPSHWRRGVLHATDIALTLSGHTHAGQLRIGRFSPARWAYNEWGGKYTEDGSMLYVSLGVGGTVPFRLGAWPEVNVITLRR
jgi:predicted MPP superfamily phosphohydrolase